MARPSIRGGCDIGKKTTKTKSTNEPAAWAKPYLTGAAGTISDTVAQNQPGLQHISDGIAGQLPGLGAMAFGPQPGLDAAQGYAQDVLGGKYLNSNPYTEQMAHQGEQDAANRVNSTYSMAGRTGSGAAGYGLAKGVADAGNAVRFGQYNTERANQNTAMAAQPSLTAAQYAGVAPYLAAAQTAGTLPYAGIQNLGQIGGLVGNYGTQTQTQPGGWGTALMGALGNAFSFAPISLSDRRMKADIVELGPWDDRGDGLKRYGFRYKWEKPGTQHIGVMADEVKALRPKAYVPNFVGEFAGVNYAELAA